MKDLEHIVLVDENDREVGKEDKLLTHKLGLLHRAFSVFIFRELDGKIELLLQKRNRNKYHSGGLWTNTCCSHPRVGESIADAGRRRLQEEMHIEAKVIPIGSFTYRAEFSNGLVEHEYDHVLIGVYQDNVTRVNNMEVEDFKWITPEELEKELTCNHEIYTSWFNQAWRIVEEHFDKVKVLLNEFKLGQQIN